jgi:hypothetical protein
MSTDLLTPIVSSKRVRVLGLAMCGIYSAVIKHDLDEIVTNE